MTSNPEVTQADVEAAALYWVSKKDRETFPEDIEYFRHNWRALDGMRHCVEAFARHRTQAEAKSKVEIAEAIGALRWLRAFWEPGSDHDTQEVQHALAAADALLAKHSEKPDA